MSQEINVTSEKELENLLNQDQNGSSSVSRMDVRKAIASLTDEGLIDVRPQKGTVIKVPNKQYVEDAKGVIASIAATQLVGRLTSPKKLNIEKLRDILSSLKENLATDAYNLVENPTKANHLILEKTEDIFEVLFESPLKSKIFQQCYSLVRLGDKPHEKDLSRFPELLENLVDALENRAATSTIKAMESAKAIMQTLVGRDRTNAYFQSYPALG